MNVYSHPLTEGLLVTVFFFFFLEIFPRKNVFCLNVFKI